LKEQPFAPHRRGLLHAGAASLAAAPGVAGAAAKAWNAGPLVHLLPAASHDRFWIKASFNRAIEKPPRLVVDGVATPGERSDVEGRYWRFGVSGLKPATAHTLRLTDHRGRSLCDPWPLSTFPAPESRPDRVRLLSFTCAGGYHLPPGPRQPEGFRTPAVRRRLLERALTFQPDAAIANGDHVYWDQKSWLESSNKQLRELVRAFYGKIGFFNPDLPVMGSENERIIKRLAEPQISQVYGVSMRSTPMFFVSDDHDYFENDEATRDRVTFPPDDFNIRLQRGTQHLFYPEFLPVPGRPPLPGSNAADRWEGLSECFGTLRWGDLLEVLIYDCGRYLTLKGPHAGLVPPEAERWLAARAADPGVRHLIHAPSHPPGWSAGKWREWYPDVVETDESVSAQGPVEAMDSHGPGANPRLSTRRAKFMWQEGWWAQHQRLLKGLRDQPGRAAVFLSGDLHAIGAARILRSGDLDLSANPVHSILSGPISTSAGSWPSAVRGIAPRPPSQLTLEGDAAPLERNGFTLLDVERDRIVVRQFAWREPEPVEAIDRLQPYKTYEIRRPRA
jgi:hypothetical protein